MPGEPKVWERPVADAVALYELTGEETVLDGDTLYKESHDSSVCICWSLGWYAQRTCTCSCHKANEIDVWKVTT